MNKTLKDMLVVFGLYVVSLFTGVAQEVLWGYSSDTAYLAGLLHWIIMIQVYFYIMKDTPKSDKEKQ